MANAMLNNISNRLRSKSDQGHSDADSSSSGSRSRSSRSRSKSPDTESQSARNRSSSRSSSSGADTESVKSIELNEIKEAPISITISQAEVKRILNNKGKQSIKINVDGRTGKRETGTPASRQRDERRKLVRTKMALEGKYPNFFPAGTYADLVDLNKVLQDNNRFFDQLEEVLLDVCYGTPAVALRAIFRYILGCNVVAENLTTVPQEGKLLLRKDLRHIYFLLECVMASSRHIKPKFRDNDLHKLLSNEVKLYRDAVKRRAKAAAVRVAREAGAKDSPPQLV